MKSMQLLGAAMGQKKKKIYTPESNASAALHMSKKFLAHLANEEFFKGKASEGMSPRRNFMLEDRFAKFASTNKIMLTPVGDLCLPHIEHFIDGVFDTQDKTGKQLSKFDIVILVSKYQGGDHEEV